MLSHDRYVGLNPLRRECPCVARRQPQLRVPPATKSLPQTTQLPPHSQAQSHIALRFSTPANDTTVSRSNFIPVRSFTWGGIFLFRCDNVEPYLAFGTFQNDPGWDRWMRSIVAGQESQYNRIRISLALWAPDCSTQIHSASARPARPD